MTLITELQENGQLLPGYNLGMNYPAASGGGIRSNQSNNHTKLRGINPTEIKMTLSKHLRVPVLVAGTIALNAALLSSPPETILIAWGALIIGVFMVALALRSLSYVFATWLFIVPFFPNVRGLNNSLDLGVANVTPERFLFIVLIALFFISIFLKKTQLLRFTYIEKIMLAFCLVLLTSLSIYDNFDRYHLGMLASRYLIPMLAFFIAKNIFREDRDVAVFIWLLFTLGAYLAATACFEYFDIQSLIFPRYIANPEVGGFLDRARGPFLQAAENGTAIGMLFFTTIYLYGRVRSSLLRGVIIGTGCVILLGVFFSLTRGAWIGTALGLLVVAISHRSFRRCLIPAVVIGVVTLPLLVPLVKSQRPEGAIAARAANVDNVYYRFNAWLSGLKMFSEHPIFGVGFTRFPELNYFYQNDEIISQAGGVQLSGGDAAHNTYIEIASELGLVGLIPYFILICSMLSMSVKLYHSLPTTDSNGKDFIIVFWGAALTYFVSSSFVSQNSLFLTSLLFALAGIISRWSVLLTVKSRARFAANISRERSLRCVHHPAGFPQIPPRSY